MEFDYLSYHHHKNEICNIRNIRNKNKHLIYQFQSQNISYFFNVTLVTLVTLKSPLITIKYALTIYRTRIQDM